MLGLMVEPHDPPTGAEPVTPASPAVTAPAPTQAAAPHPAPHPAPLDQGYSAAEIGAYGDQQQPAIAARMAPQLRMVQIGGVAAVAGVGCAVGAVARFPAFEVGDGGGAWAVVALVGAVAMLAIAAIQLLTWQRALASWRGQRPQDLNGERRLSWIAHLVSYLVVLVVLLATMGGSAYATWQATAATFLALTLLFVVTAQVLAGVQFLRPSGPPGTLPAHMRRLMARAQANEDRRAEAEDR